MIPPRPARLLVRLPNPVGDAVAATPLLAALRRCLPGTHILAAGPPACAELLSGLDSFDEFLPLPSRGVGAQAAVLRAAEAGAALLLPNSWSSALAARRARIPWVAGRRGRGRRWLLHSSLRPIPGPAPMSALYLDLLQLLGLPRVETPARLTVTRKEEALAEARLKDAPGPFFAVAPGAAFGPSKIYPLGQMEAAIRGARRATGCVPLLLGGPGEAELLGELAGRLDVPVLSTHELPAGLGEMKALLRRCRVLLTMDTGARHLAAALGVPQVVLYGPTDPRWSASALDRTTILRRDGIECSPCHKQVCPIDHRCLAGIPPESVSAAVAAAVAPPPPIRSGVTQRGCA